MLFDDPAKQEFVQENILAKNYYYQKKINDDPERCKANIERAIKRKERELQVSISCNHNAKDWCQVRAVPFEDLENFHDRYWDCVGTVNKRVFVANCLTVEPVSSPKKDLNITCHIERSNGQLILVCQKSFISILGVSKHKVLAIGKAKLTNSEQLLRETRGGRRIKGVKGLHLMEATNLNGTWFDDSFDSESGTSSKRIKLNDSQSHEGSVTSEVGIYPNVELNDDDEDPVNEDNYDDDDDDDEEEDEPRDIFEPQVEMTEATLENDSDDDIDIFQPEVELTEAPQIGTTRKLGIGFHRRSTDEYENSEDDEPVVAKPGPGWLKKPVRPRSHRPIKFLPIKPKNSFPNEKFIKPDMANAANAARKQQQLLMQKHLHNQKNNKHTDESLDQQPFEMVECQISEDTSFSKRNFLGPENWKRTLERNIKRQLREKKVSIACTHALTRFCKIQRIPMQDLISFHNAYWQCDGIVEERLFLARWLIVQPKNHRREMAICHRIPCRDGAIYEVCQKSFLSVVGITKHKVQAAARAKLRGELYKKDGRGGNTSNFRSQIKESNYFPNTKQIQISSVIGNYDLNRSEDQIEIKNEPTDEIIDTEDEKDIITREPMDDESREFIEPADIEEKYNKILRRIKCELNFYKRRTKKLSTDRRKLFNQINRLKKTEFNITNSNGLNDELSRENEATNNNHNFMKILKRNEQDGKLNGDNQILEKNLNNVEINHSNGSKNLLSNETKNIKNCMKKFDPNDHFSLKTKIKAEFDNSTEQMHDDSE